VCSQTAAFSVKLAGPDQPMYSMVRVRRRAPNQLAEVFHCDAGVLFNRHNQNSLSLRLSAQIGVYFFRVHNCWAVTVSDYGQIADCDSASEYVDIQPALSGRFQ
jgi:hypothetical protein